MSISYPSNSLLPTRAFIDNATTITVLDEGDVESDAAVVVEDGVLSSITLDGLSAIVLDEAEVTIGADTYTFTVVGGEITNIVVT